MLLLAWFFVFVFCEKKIEAYTVNKMRAIEYKIINVKNHNDFFDPKYDIQINISILDIDCEDLI